MKLIDAMLLVSFFCCFTFYLIFIIPFWCVQTSVKYLTPDIPLVFGIRSIQATANCMLFLHQACNVCLCVSVCVCVLFLYSLSNLWAVLFSACKNQTRYYLIKFRTVFACKNLQLQQCFTNCFR